MIVCARFTPARTSTPNMLTRERSLAFARREQHGMIVNETTRCVHWREAAAAAPAMQLISLLGLSKHSLVVVVHFLFVQRKKKRGKKTPFSLSSTSFLFCQTNLSILCRRRRRQLEVSDASSSSYFLSNNNNNQRKSIKAARNEN